MPANVYDERMATLDKRAWWDYKGAHVFGKDERLDLIAAGERAGVYFPVLKLPMWVMLGERRIVRAQDVMALVRGRHTLVDPQGKPITHERAVIGTCKTTYPIISNKRICQMLNEASLKWPVESVGALNDGATLIVSLNMGGWELAGESYQNIFGLIEKRDGTQSLVCMYTTVRMVCENTALMALNAATFSIKVPHTTTFKADAQFAVDLMVRAEEVAKRAQAEAERLVKVKITESDVAEMTVRLYPEPVMPGAVARSQELLRMGVDISDMSVAVERAAKRHEVELTRMMLNRDLTIEAYDRICDESPLGGTGWGYYQAAIQVADHKKGRGDRALSALVGERAKVKLAAFDLVAAL